MNQYWVTEWAKLRQDEVIRIPDDYKIHSDFTLNDSEKEIKSAFTEINLLYTNIYGDIANCPEEFGAPLYEKGQYRVFSKQWRDASVSVYRPFILLFHLMNCGEAQNQGILVSVDKYKNISVHKKGGEGSLLYNPVKNAHILFRKLEDYGFIFEGLKNYKIATNNVYITYPDNFNILLVLKLMAEKAYNTSRLEDFLCCHFRLFQDDINTANYGYGADDVADRVITEKEKEFVYKMDETLMERGLYRKSYGGVECHGLAYYASQKVMDSKAPYSFRMVSRSFDIEHNVSETEKMLLLLRIRNVTKCLEYLESCPESVKEIFRFGDKGCDNRPCDKGVGYKFEGKDYWRCGCCAPAFKFKPNTEDIPHYIRLVELGEKK